MGIGDRFCHQGKAQLDAIIAARRLGVNVTPVWNKSHREHSIIGTSPADTRTEADSAVKALSFSCPYYVDADHINLSNVDLFIASSDFFTIDVADYISKPPSPSDLQTFIDNNRGFIGSLEIPGVGETLHITESDIQTIGQKFLTAVKEAGRIYRRIEDAKGKGSFITEVSMDESNQPQSPVEMLFILSAVAAESIPARTIAPKFTGRFNKGVDYVGDIARFTKEFNADIAVIAFAVEQFSLPADLKLSIHSGSDKFSIYAPIKDALRKFDAGVHLKTAGTTWLEELIGLASAGSVGLQIAKDIYTQSLTRYDELCKPYATVIDIDKAKLPTPRQVASWDGPAFASALRHDQTCPQYNLHFRQMLHLSYKLAAEMGTRFTHALEEYEPTIAENVTENILTRHLKRVF
jgi:hypothetical protein